MTIPKEIVQRVIDRANIVEVISESVPLRKAGRNYTGYSPWNKEKTPSFVVSPDKSIFKDFSSGRAGNVVRFMMEFHGLSFLESIKSLAAKYGVTIPNVSTDKDSEEFEKKDKILAAIFDAAEFFKKSVFSDSGKAAFDYFLSRSYDRDVIRKFDLGAAPNDWGALRDYLVNKGYSKEILTEAGLTRTKENSDHYYDYFRNRAIFTIKDFLGRPVGFGARQLNSDDQPKYLNSPQNSVYDKSKILYGIFEAKNSIRNSNFAIITEGYTDVITMHNFGFTQAVASSGTALTESQLELIKRYTNKIYFLYDSDEAGQKATERGIELALKQSFDVKIITLPDGEDPDSFLKNQGKAAFEMRMNASEDFIAYLFNRIKMQGKLDTVAAKANSARELVKLINLIPDRLQHDFYINTVASKIGLTFDQVRLIYREKANLKTEQNRAVSPETTEADEYRKHIADYKNMLLSEEIMLLRYAMDDASYLDLMFEEYGIDYDFFLSDLGKKLYQTINDHSAEKNILGSILDDDSINKTYKDLLGDIALSQDETSESWAKHGAEELITDHKRIIKDCKLSIQIKRLKSQISFVQEKFKAQPETIEPEDLHTYQNLTKELITLEEELKS